MDGKFIVGLAVGAVVGMLLIDSSSDVKKFVEKGKDVVTDKIQEIKENL